MTDCPARLENRKRLETDLGRWLPVVYGPANKPPQGWWIATDGSGQTMGHGKNATAHAGWGTIIFRQEAEGQVNLNPDFILHAPVVLQDWDHRWIGAREATNNTAELSAIGEAMLWLLEEVPDDGTLSVKLRYDSEYAAKIAHGIWEGGQIERGIGTDSS